jgi:transcriptional regulator with XRE-family HTH domain
LAKSATPKSATKIDKAIGQKIRAQRLLKEMTQERLGQKLGVTFQQIQKYELGINRVGSGRLYEIAEIFEVPLASFFEDGKSSATSRERQSPYALLDDPLTMQILKEFMKIEDKARRQSLVLLIEKIVAKS